MEKTDDEVGPDGVSGRTVNPLAPKIHDKI